MTIDIPVSEIERLSCRVTVYGSSVVVLDGVLSYSVENGILRIALEHGGEELFHIWERISICRLYHGKRILKVEDIPSIGETLVETANNGHSNLVRGWAGLLK